ncbi:MAG: DNA alkylation repair protein [candidate division Zixibacteria bacterium]|nr:DNA alkylation repair protein [candidate division Zixibacteria bacterium]
MLRKIVTPPSVVQKLLSALSSFSHSQYFMNMQRFEKEKLENPMVLRTPVVRKISAEHFKEIKSLPKDEIFKLCEELLKNGDGNLGEIARDWAYRCRRRYEKKDFKTFESWLKKYVKSWGPCDHLCAHPLGHLILQYPELAPKVKKWAKSKNRWERRAAAVTLIPALRRRLLLKEAFQTADILLQDEEDLVQKGYGWMLKEASNRFPKEVFRYVMKNRKKMPRTALRYAIEKMPAGWKKKAMRKEE